jgi:hypothetical protein
MFESCDTYNSTHKMDMDPRLTGYLKKKQYYKKNNIDSSNLENEFGITKDDLMKIRAYLRNDKVDHHSEFIKIGVSSFPSEKFASDPRFERMKKKTDKEKEALASKSNLKHLEKEYDMYRKDRPYASLTNNDFSSFTEPLFMQESRDDRMYNPNVSTLPFSDKKQSMSKNNTYVHPKSRYNGYLDNQFRINSDVIPDVTTKFDDGEGGSKIFGRTMSDMRSNLSDIDTDTFIRFGETPSRSKKSLGYPSTFEHQFDYISDDLQMAEHTVSNRGMPSRVYNKEKTTKY